MSKPRSIVDRFLAGEKVADIEIALDIVDAEPAIRRALKKARKAEAAMVQADLVIQRLMDGCESEVHEERLAAFEFCQEAYEPDQPLGAWANSGGRK